MNRRKFLRNTGVTLGSAAVGPAFFTGRGAGSTEFVSASLDTWQGVRNSFLLDHHHIQMAQMLLASHPQPVRQAIDRYRKVLDENPATFWEENWLQQREEVIQAAAKYMECNTGEVGLTGSTTEGMAMLMNGFKLQPGDEVLSTTHDHYITDMAIDYACDKRGANVRRIAEYGDPSTATADEIVTKIRSAIRAETRLVVVTWVHSCTGVKLPVKAISEAIAEINADRIDDDRIYFLVDGVHGFGNQAQPVSSLGCDFFAAGTHKWLFGPRGTGIVYGRQSSWHMMEPTVPTFRMNPFLRWMGEEPENEPTFTDILTPGGFHSFEYRWALKEAFEFQMEIGREKVHARTNELSKRLKEAIAEMPHVHLHTPVDPSISAGINAFQIGDRAAEDLVADFHDRGIIASASPYKVSYARLTPCIINTEDEVDRCIEAMKTMRT